MTKTRRLEAGHYAKLRQRSKGRTEFWISHRFPLMRPEVTTLRQRQHLRLPSKCDRKGFCPMNLTAFRLLWCDCHD